MFLEQPILSRLLSALVYSLDSVSLIYGQRYMTVCMHTLIVVYLVAYSATIDSVRYRAALTYSELCFKNYYSFQFTEELKCCHHLIDCVLVSAHWIQEIALWLPLIMQDIFDPVG